MTANRQSKVGLLLIVLGGLVLLAKVGVWGGSSFIGALFLVAGGAFLMRLYNRKPKHLWALFVGFALFGAAAAALGGALAGSAFLALLGVGFAVAYVQNRRYWWAVLPAGMLFTLATVAGADALLPGADAGPLFFVGLAATFGYLYRMPLGKRWAVYPAIAALALAILSGSFSAGPLLPLLLVGAGAYLFSRTKMNKLESEAEPLDEQKSSLELLPKATEPTEKV